jgi:hypothetical protein
LSFRRLVWGNGLGRANFGFLEVGLALAMSALTQGSRYDDSVLNLLRLESDRSPAARTALYRNLIDLMMQNRAC